MGVVVLQDPQTNLFHVIQTLGAAGCFTSILNSRQQHCGQRCNDRHHDKQLNKSESRSAICRDRRPGDRPSTAVRHGPHD